MGVKSFIKQSVSFVSAMAMACSMVVMPAGASYAAGTNDNLHLSKGIKLQSDGNYKITLEAYATGQDTTTITKEPVPLDIVLVLDQSGSMTKSFGSTTRLNALKNAVTNFVSTVKDDATKNDVNHRISMVGFASTKGKYSSSYKNTEILTVKGSGEINYKTSSDNNSTFENALKDSLMDVRTQSDKINQAINWLDASGDTYSEYGMDMASRILAKYPVQEGENRKQIIVMFTDGYTAPANTNNIDYSMSDRAIANSKVAKDNGATVYTIGIFDGADPNMDINNNYEYGSTNSSRQLVAANRYMNLVSSNYPQAENMTTTGTKAEKATYYQSASNATELNNIFETISKSETTSGTTVTLTGESVLRDIVSDKFELPKGAEASSVSVYTADSDKVSTDGIITWKDRVEDKSNTYPVSIDGNKVDVTGFNYSENYVTANHKGKKLIVEILVNGLQSGTNMNSNDTEQAKSGIYENTSATTAVKNFVSPKVTIPEYSYVLDYGKKVTIPNTDESQDKAYSETTQMNSTKAAPTTLTSIKKTYGTFAFDNNKQLTYQPGRINWNGFDSIFSFSKKADDKYEWSKTNVIPANSVYYEDDFASTETVQDGDTGTKIIYGGTGNWTVDGTPQNIEKQSSDNSQYGWDNSYDDDTNYSNGTAHKGTTGATATFKFTGTGVDIYSRTDLTTGKVIATLTEDGETVGSKFMIVDNKSASGTYYQVPTLFFEGLEYGTYEVKIQVLNPIQDGDTSRGTYYLDGIRVYNPLGVATSEKVTNAYNVAGESNAIFTSVRQMLLDANTFDGDTVENGAVFIDQLDAEDNNISGEATTETIGTYDKLGPKNEVYLDAGQAIAFKINTPYTGKVFIGAKSLNGQQVTMKVTDITATEKTKSVTLSHTSDMYYEINPTTEGYVVIQNTNTTQGAVLAITKLRLTGVTTTSSSVTLEANSGLMNYVNQFSTLSSAKTDDKGMVVEQDKADVEIQNPEEDNKDNNNQESKPDQSNSNSIWNSIMNNLRKWFK